MNDHIAASAGGKLYRLHAEDEKYWRRIAAGKWEPDTFDILGRCLRRDSVYVDVGAWVGATVLFAAARCATVYCIEPDPAAYERLLANLRMNCIGNVLPLHAALGAANARVEISCERGFGKSMTRVRDENNIGGESDGSDGGMRATVLSLTPARFIKWWEIEKIDVLKIDIEGGEFDLAPALPEIFPRMKPVIHLSLHAPLFPQSLRENKLTRIVELASHYAFCYDRDLRKVTPPEILGKGFREHFATLVLADEYLR